MDNTMTNTAEVSGAPDRATCELDWPVWSVITHRGVIQNKLTYDQAKRAVELLGDKLSNEATIGCFDDDREEFATHLKAATIAAAIV